MFVAGLLFNAYIHFERTLRINNNIDMQSFGKHIVIFSTSLLFPLLRLSLLEEWRGIRDEALSALSGIKGCIFVHAGGFIGGNETREGALNMARKTLQHRDNLSNGKSFTDPELIQVDSKEI